MNRVRDVAVAAAMALFGAMWLFAAGAKLASPLAPYEFLARVVPAGPLAKSVFAASIGIEALLGAAMLLRAIPAAVGLALSVAGLAAASATLLMVRARSDGFVQCGCYGTAVRMSIDGELAVNAAMAAVLAALLVWMAATRRRA